MKYINIFLCFIFLQHIGIAQQKPLLKDFTIEEVPVENRKSSYYLLHLKDSSNNITLRLFAQPIKIIDSYLDNKYLVIVYKSKMGIEFIAGAYKDEDSDSWKSDYFHVALESLMHNRYVSDANFIDGETVMLTYDIHERAKDPRKEYRILRIGKGRIWTYTKRNQKHFNYFEGNNPIRPVE